ncbi:MAG: calcium-binding protein [Roseobacter sp.]
MENLLQDADQKLTFGQYSVSDHWVGEVDEIGRPVLSTSVETILNVPYELEFNLAANLSSGVQRVTVEVFFGGDSIGSFLHEGGVFESYSFDLVGTGDTSTLEFLISNLPSGANDVIDASGVVPSYSKTMTFLGNEVTVEAFAPGQNFIYQVLNGQLVKFDLGSNSYTETETPAAVDVNAIGYSGEDDLIYGIARSSGVDAAGVPISGNDVIAMDATGATYVVASGRMSSYIGDVDDKGNLWTFSGNLTTAVVYDLSETDQEGALASQTLNLSSVGAPTRGLADLAYHPASETFFGVAHGGSAGQPGTLVSIDVSQVALGGDPIVTTQPIAGTIVDGFSKEGIPSSAFGATMVDGDGNVYIGANNADHDLDTTTDQQGGFYRITSDAEGALFMELLASAPRVASNDGALDTRGVDPFLGIDTASTVLLRAPVLSVAVAEDDYQRLAAKGDEVRIDLLANDEVSEGESLTLTHLNGIKVDAGDTVKLANEEMITYLGDGIVAVTPGREARDVTAELTYTMQNESGIKDTATLTIETSPVQGTAGSDHMVGFADADGTHIDGPDGTDDVILGYGGKDKIFAGAGDDDIYGGSGNDFLRGQAGDDFLYGEADNDVLDGGSGADKMYGGTGNDTYFVDSVDDFVSEAGGAGKDTVKSKVSFVLGGGFENLWLSKGSEASDGTGNALRNMIVGNENDNLINGHAGNDNLLGQGGNDVIYGGAGHDKLHGGDGADTLHGGEGNDKLHGGSGADTTYGGDGDDTLCPGAGDDIMYGGAGRDLLSGNAGADTAYGGLGNDTYKVSDAFDTIIEYADEGHDVVHASVDFALSEHVEDLILLDSGDFGGSGNAGNNRITGNTGDNALAGAAGDDHLTGGVGDDTLAGDAGADKLLGGAGDDQLSGGAGADTLSGGIGADVLTGGFGDDFMCGDAGADIFHFWIGDGRDEIKAFETGVDAVHFVGMAADDLVWTEDHRGVRVEYGMEDSILFRGLTLGDAASMDLLFV